MDDDDRRPNVAGAESGTEASPAPEPREMEGRERDLAPDPDTARGDFGNSSLSRLGMPSMLTGLLVLAIAIAIILAMVL
jgi:hypothetical protein